MRNWTPFWSFWELNWTPFSLEPWKHYKNRGFVARENALKYVENAPFFFSPWFLEILRKVHFLRSRFLMSPEHYKNRGFGTSGVKVEKTRPLRGVSLCFGEARDFRSKIPLFCFARPNMLFGAVPETTIFIVVSGAHTGVVLVHVPGTTTKIVVSGTWGKKEKPAEPKKGGKSRMTTCFGVLCLKPPFLQWFQAQTLGWFLLMWLKPLVL